MENNLACFLLYRKLSALDDWRLLRLNKEHLVFSLTLASAIFQEGSHILPMIPGALFFAPQRHLGTRQASKVAFTIRAEMLLMSSL